MPVGIIGVTWAKLIFNVGIVLRALIGVFNEQTNAGAGGGIFKHTGEDLHRILFAPRCGVTGCTRLAPI